MRRLSVSHRRRDAYASGRVGRYGEWVCGDVDFKKGDLDYVGVGEGCCGLGQRSRRRAKPSQSQQGPMPAPAPVHHRNVSTRCRHVMCTARPRKQLQLSGVCATAFDGCFHISSLSASLGRYLCSARRDLSIALSCLHRR
jgi:hypothetical protein